MLNYFLQVNNITSSVKAKGDKPSKPWREGILYLLKDVTL